MLVDEGIWSAGAGLRAPRAERDHVLCSLSAAMFHQLLMASGSSAFPGRCYAALALVEATYSLAVGSLESKYGLRGWAFILST